jgi:hypothetical protein
MSEKMFGMPEQIKKVDEKPEEISRRDFLKKMGKGAMLAAGAAVVGAGIFESKKSQDAQEEKRKEQSGLRQDIKMNLYSVEDNIKYLEDNLNADYHEHFDRSDIEDKSEYSHKPRITDSAEIMKKRIESHKEKITVFRQKIENENLVLSKEDVDSSYRLSESIKDDVSKLKHWSERDHKADKRAEEWNKKRTNNFEGWRE